MRSNDNEPHFWASTSRYDGPTTFALKSIWADCTPSDKNIYYRSRDNEFTLSIVLDGGSHIDVDHLRVMIVGEMGANLVEIADPERFPLCTNRISDVGRPLKLGGLDAYSTPRYRDVLREHASRNSSTSQTFTGDSGRSLTIVFVLTDARMEGRNFIKLLGTSLQRPKLPQHSIVLWDRTLSLSVMGKAVSLHFALESHVVLRENYEDPFYFSALYQLPVFQVRVLPTRRRNTTPDIPIEVITRIASYCLNDGFQMGQCTEDEHVGQKEFVACALVCKSWSAIIEQKFKEMAASVHPKHKADYFGILFRYAVRHPEVGKHLVTFTEEDQKGAFCCLQDSKTLKEFDILCKQMIVAGYQSLKKLDICKGLFPIVRKILPLLEAIEEVKFGCLSLNGRQSGRREGKGMLLSDLLAGIHGWSRLKGLTALKWDVSPQSDRFSKCLQEPNYHLERLCLDSDSDLTGSDELSSKLLFFICPKAAPFIRFLSLSDLSISSNHLCSFLLTLSPVLEILELKDIIVEYDNTISRSTTVRYAIESVLPSLIRLSWLKISCYHPELMYSSIILKGVRRTPERSNAELEKRHGSLLLHVSPNFFSLGTLSPLLSQSFWERIFICHWPDLTDEASAITNENLAKSKAEEVGITLGVGFPPTGSYSDPVGFWESAAQSCGYRST